MSDPNRYVRLSAVLEALRDHEQDYQRWGWEFADFLELKFSSDSPTEGQVWFEVRTGPPLPGSWREWTWTLTRPGPRPGDWYGKDRQGHEKFLRREWFESGRLERRSD